MATVYRVGELVNASERKAVECLKKALPENYTIFHNLEIGGTHGSSEYDQIIVGEHAIYAIEVKGYHGRIRGNAGEWEIGTNYFAPSPLTLVRMKAKVLKGRLVRYNPLLRHVWVEPLVVLTEPDVQIELDLDQVEFVMPCTAAAIYMQTPTRSRSIGSLAKLACDIIRSKFGPLRRVNHIMDYKVIDTIGENELYSTLLAENSLLHAQRRCVLKVYNVHPYVESAEALRREEERLMREAEALHRLAPHANVVRAYQPFRWVDHDGQTKLVVPRHWVEGFTLRSLLDTGQIDKLTLEQKLDIVRQICAGLQHAHTHGVIHRDMRPENVVVPQDGPIALINFDCARVEDASLDSIATRIGLLLDEHYMAPEVKIDPKLASRSSDFYSVGIMFFEMLVGQLPFQAMSEVFDAGGLPKLPTQTPAGSKRNLPKIIDKLISTLCAFHPDDRYTDSTQLLDDLSRIE